MTPQTDTAAPDQNAIPKPTAWQEQYASRRENLTEGAGPKIKVLSKLTLTFVEGAGTQGRHAQIEAKPTIQEVDRWIEKTDTFKLASQDGSIIVVTGAEPLIHTQLVPPTVAEVMQARPGCSQEDAENIVALEQVRFDQGEYPYPAKGAAVIEAEPTATAQLQAELAAKDAQLLNLSQRLEALEKAQTASPSDPPAPPDPAPAPSKTKK